MFGVRRGLLDFGGDDQHTRGINVCVHLMKGEAPLSTERAGPAYQEPVGEIATHRITEDVLRQMDKRIVICWRWRPLAKVSHPYVQPALPVLPAHHSSRFSSWRCIMCGSIARNGALQIDNASQ